jgi:cysteine-S-conjugate beta-lyase
VSDVPDPFGLRSLDVATLRGRPGTKWRRPGGLLAAWVADMDFPVAPAIRDSLVELATTDVGYPDWDRSGRSHLPELFAERMAGRMAWSPEVERLWELDDVIQGVRIAVHHLTEPGDGIVLHTPAYPPFFDSIERMGRRVVPVPYPFDHRELDRRLRTDRARLMILCHPHNPTGHVFDEHELGVVAEVAARHDLVVVSDEIHADLVYEPHRHVPFASLGEDLSRRTVTVTSASKAFNLAGLRWAIMHAGCDRLHQAMAALPPHYFGAPNIMGVAATEAAWLHGDDWLTAVRAVLDENRRQLVELVRRHLPGVVYHVPDATYLAWLDCRAVGIGDDPAAAFRRHGVELSRGPTFGSDGAGHVRLNFATSPAVLHRIVTAMAAALP